MPTIGYNNLFETGTVTVDSEDPSYPKENAYDWLPYPGDVWKPAASGTHYIMVYRALIKSKVNYFAIYSHDVDSITVQYSNDYWSTFSDLFVPMDSFFKYSEEFDNAAWIKVASSIIANYVIAPNGKMVADKLVENNVYTRHGVTITSSITVSAGEDYVVSVFSKAAERSQVHIFLESGKYAYFDLLTGVVISTTGSVTASITDIGNGWYRCAISTNKGSTSYISPTIYSAVSGNSLYSGDGVSGIYLFGASMTKTSSPQHYVKTTAVSAPAIAPNGSGVIYREFDAVEARDWRFKVVKAGAPSSLGIIAIGEKLTIPESVQVGFSPANLARTNKYLNSTSDEGQFLGRRLVRNGAEMSLSFDLLSPAFVRNSWDVFIQHAEAKPFFFAWDYANYPTEVAFCWTSGKIEKPVYSLPNFMRVVLNVKANT